MHSYNRQTQRHRATDRQTQTQGQIDSRDSLHTGIYSDSCHRQIEEKQDRSIKERIGIWPCPWLKDSKRKCFYLFS